MAVATFNRSRKLVSLLSLSVLLTGCGEEPEDFYIEICKGMAAELAINPTDIVFARSRSEPPDGPDRRVTIEFDDTDECGGRVRRTVACSVEGFVIRRIYIGGQALDDRVREAVWHEAVAKWGERRRERQNRLWNRVVAWLDGRATDP
jgi:hypothetical protein